ncbi:uncharacterized protein [Montipora capricornis]|uniref:uncharacterized protein n=1 Tax=Montipora capricornis TaxID=246305 RepID=UPI0035F1E742
MISPVDRSDMALSKFQLLLNNLSNELNERNLQSLIHICGELIPGGQRDGIRTGWHVFTILLHQNAIGEDPERQRFLLRIFEELRPKRRDMVRMIKRHIQENCEQPETILGDLESSGEINFPSRPTTPVVMNDYYSGCLLRCGCLNCSCTPRSCDCCCCCVIFAILFVFLAAACALVWYTPIFPEVQHFRNKCGFVGPLVIFVFVFVAVSCALCAGYQLCLRKRGRELDYSSLLSSGDHNSTSNQAVYDDGKYAASVSTRTSSRTFPSRMERSQSSGRVTASSSHASLGSSRPTTFSPALGITSDGCSKQNVFNIDDEEDQESKENYGSTEDTKGLNDNML